MHRNRKTDAGPEPLVLSHLNGIKRALLEGEKRPAFCRISFRAEPLAVLRRRQRSYCCDRDFTGVILRRFLQPRFLGAWLVPALAGRRLDARGDKFDPGTPPLQPNPCHGALPRLPARSIMGRVIL